MLTAHCHVPMHHTDINVKTHVPVNTTRFVINMWDVYERVGYFLKLNPFYFFVSYFLNKFSYISVPTVIL